MTPETARISLNVLKDCLYKDFPIASYSRKDGGSSDFFQFLVVRNPFQRLVSSYSMKAPVACTRRETCLGYVNVGLKLVLILGIGDQPLKPGTTTKARLQGRVFFNNAEVQNLFF